MKLKLVTALAFLGYSFFFLLSQSTQAQTYSPLVPGTLLVVPKFDVTAETESSFRIVNTSAQEVRFHYNYVCPGVPRGNDTCRKLDRTITLTPNETKEIDVASQHPPCNRGFVIGYPINSDNRPISFNFLYGSYRVHTGRRTLDDNIVAIQSVRPVNSVLGGPNGFSFVAGPDQDFASIAPTFLTDFLSNDGVSLGTRLVFLDIGTALGQRNPISNVNVDFWNSSEVPFSTSLEFVCWTEIALEQIDENFLTDNLGTAYGSMRAEAILNCPIAGTCPPNLPKAPLLIGIIEESGNLPLPQGLLAAAAAESDHLSGRSFYSVPCNDGNPDTIDSFDPLRGCVFTSPSGCTSNEDCDDDEGCTEDFCSEGLCINEVISCNDQNACTTDRCNSDEGVYCTNSPVSCDDNNACTADSCSVQGGCGNVAIDCNDNNACTADSCNPQFGCVFVPDDGPGCNGA